MMGMAKQLFVESEGYSPWQEKGACRWPLLEKGWRIGCFSYVDYAFAEMLLRDIPEAAELTAAFLCHLSRACREGHICVRVEGGVVTPSPKELWFSEVTEDKIDDLIRLAEQLAEGASALPELLITGPICRQGNLYYFQKYWILESLFTENFQRLLLSTPILDIPFEKVDKKQLNVQQASAIQNALTKSFSVICGGPGTGKTYTAGHLIKLFWESLDEEQKKGCEICLAAPTGKAAANLQKSLQRATAEIEGFKPLKAKTLHALLGIRSSSFSIDSPPKQLKADLILVDESSMIDVRIMALLLASVKTGTRLVLLGDRFQLPPVEAGSLFSDVITFLRGDERFSENVSELKTCLRVELQEMIDFATAINHGNDAKVLALLNDKNNTSAIERVGFDAEGGNPRTIQDRLIEYAATLFPSPKVGQNEPGHLLDLYNQFRLLSPLRNGLFGVNEINQKFLLRMMQRVRREEWFAVPIMIVNNDYKMDLFNGEVGVLIRRRSYDSYVKEGDYALFPMDQGESFRKIPAILLPKYEYAYCLSVHKSQGSEFDRVLLLLPQGSEVFGREVLYTAVTRARKKLEVWGAEEVLIQTLAKSSTRVSGLTCG